MNTCDKQNIAKKLREQFLCIEPERGRYIPERNAFEVYTEEKRKEIKQHNYISEKDLKEARKKEYEKRKELAAFQSAYERRQSSCR